MPIRKIQTAFLSLSTAILLGACSLLPIGTPTPEGPAPVQTQVQGPPTETPQPPPPIELAEITFRVTIPADTPSDGPIQLSILDEVTGLALNQIHYPLQAETENIYTAVVQLPANAVIKYRYTRGGPIQAAEHTSDGRPVRYRLIHTTASGSVSDIVSRWNDTAYDGPTGRINGIATDSQTGLPIPDLMITAGGQQTFTRWDGSYLIEGLPPGTHNLVAYAMDGGYSIFQQGAVVATQASTPASFALNPAPLRLVTFFLTVPEDTIPAVPIRIAGNLAQLGNAYADLSGGISTPAARLPQMAYDPEGFYILTLNLPAGAYVQYKYTLGDGFWNMETGAEGEVRLHEFIVPDQDTVVNDTVVNWGSSAGRAPVWFAVTAPENTPETDTVWLQLNPWGWMEPLPMWRTGASTWVYLLSAPLNMVGDVQFRYCRNGDCEKGREIEPDSGRTFAPTASFQPFEGPIRAWNLLGDPGQGRTEPAVEVIPRGPGFLAGYALTSRYHPSWLSIAPAAFESLKSRGANTVFISPTWGYTRTAPPVFEPLAGLDASWDDAIALGEAAREAGLDVALLPNPRFAGNSDAWWLDAPRDYGWWVNWFEQYGYFVQHHAAMAAEIGAGTLVLGGSWLNPALPDGFMPDGFTSGIPADAETWWRDILAQARVSFGGRLAWALPFNNRGADPPAFLDAFDEIYLQWDVPLADDPEASLEEMVAAAGEALDNRLLPVYLQYTKPIVIVLYFRSGEGGAQGCVPAEEGGCLPVGAVDLAEQARAYEAVLEAVNARDWIAGVVSGEYYMPVAVYDKSPSVNGKPAGSLLETWFSGWLGLP